MANIIRQSTQIKVRIGPAVAVGDGFTPVTTLTLSGADEAELLKADGAATVDIGAATFAAVTGADGWYDLTLTTSHTDTVGELVVVVNDDSLILPIYQRFQVVEEAVYDALFAASATGLLPANVTQIGGDSQSATDLKDFADAGYDPATNKVQGVVLVDTVTTLTDHTPQTGDSFARLGAPAGASVSADIAAVKAETATIVADTNELQTDWADGGRLDLILDARASQTSVDTIDGIVGDKTGYKLASDGLDLVLVDGKTLPDSLEIIAAGVLGKASGAGTGTEVFVGLDGATTRATVTVDENGNRSNVVYS